MDARRELYEKHLYDALHAASRDYDQAILTLAAGTLALSVTFAHDIAPAPVLGSTGFLTAAWLVLGISLVAVIVSFVTSQRVIRDRIASIDNGGDAAMTRMERVTEGLNLGSGLGLVLGLVLLSKYALENTH